jgi:hypothetical protein
MAGGIVIGQMMVAEAAAAHVKVVLTGEGSDDYSAAIHGIERCAFWIQFFGCRRRSASCLRAYPRSEADGLARPERSAVRAR